MILVHDTDAMAKLIQVYSEKEIERVENDRSLDAEVRQIAFHAAP